MILHSSLSTVKLYIKKEKKVLVAISIFKMWWHYQHIKVVARFRPQNDREKQEAKAGGDADVNIEWQGGQTAVINNKSQKSVFTLDHVLPPTTTQVCSPFNRQRGAVLLLGRGVVSVITIMHSTDPYHALASAILLAQLYAIRA